MTRVVKKHLPKHVHEAKAYLRRIGARMIRVEVKNFYVISWTVGRYRMAISLALSATGNARSAWAAIRAQFKEHRLEVPA